MQNLFGTIFFLTALLMCSAIPVQAATPPNVIVIFADDLGIGDIGPYGNTRIRTPHLDSMAAEGITLTSFYSSANICTPSRGGLLLGQYPIRNGLAKMWRVPRTTLV